MHRKSFSYGAFGFIILSIIYILANPFSAAYYSREALKMCAFSIVPTLFTFMVLSRMLSHLCCKGIFDGKYTRLMSRIFNLPSCLVPVCLSGLLCGSPSGAFAICRLYDNGFCTKEEAERACILTGNCSAAFILGFVSARLGSKTAGLYIFFSNLISLFIVYYVFFRNGTLSKPFAKKHIEKNLAFTEIITESISASVTSTSILCGYVILFYTFAQIICEKLNLLLSFLGTTKNVIQFTSAVAGSFFEISSGILKSGQTDGNISMVLCAGAVGFTGLSMIFQVSAVLGKRGISLKNYFLSRCLCALLCPIILILIILISPQTVTVFTPLDKPASVTVSHVAVLIFVTAIAFAGAYLLSYLDKKHKK